MGLLGSTRSLLNGALRPFNLRLESRTAERAEAARLAGLAAAGHFERPAFPVPAQFRKCDPAPVLAAVRQFEPQLARFAAPGVADQFSFANDYYTSPDADVLYAMVRMHKPRRIIEVGSGNSTLLFRHAINDGALGTRLISIDPDPRREIARHADEVISERVETLDAEKLFSRLEANDFLFVDSSHELKAGNDVLKLFLNVFPALAPGVIVHVHDIFLPFDYPKDWLVDFRWTWTEQYLLQGLLQGGDQFEVLWAGHHFQRSLPDFERHFKFWRGVSARSVWLRRGAERPSG